MSNENDDGEVSAAQTSTPGANNNDDNSEAIVPLATGDEDPSSENRPRRRRRRGALNLDGRNLENSEDEEDDNAGGIIRDRSQRAIEAQDDDELEGEDLHEEGYTADYRALPPRKENSKSTTTAAHTTLSHRVLGVVPVQSKHKK